MLLSIVILGLVLGSFVNALIWRIHQQSSRQKKKYTGINTSVVSGRSICPNCKHVLSPIDLVPVISWLLLRGRCRYCHAKIGVQYPLVELCTAGIFALSYTAWPLGFEGVGSVQFGIWLMMLTGLVALTVYDLKWMLLPNRIVYPLGVLALAYALIGIDLGDVPRELTRLILGVGVGGGLFYVLFQLSNGRWIGGGDVKLGVVLGLLLGSPQLAFLMIFLASLLGTLVIVPGLASKRTKVGSKIPFGPFLILAAIMLVLFGSSIIDIYWGLHYVVSQYASHV